MIFLIEIPLGLILIALIVAYGTAEAAVTLIGIIVRGSMLFILGASAPFWVLGLTPNASDGKMIRHLIRGCLYGIVVVFLYLFAERVFEEPLQDFTTYYIFILAVLLLYAILMLSEKLGLGYVLLLLLFCWTIGYDLSYNVKQFESNVVYVEAVKGKTRLYPVSIDRMPEENECLLYSGGVIFDDLYEGQFVDKSHVLGYLSEGDTCYVAPDAAVSDRNWIPVVVGDKVGYLYDEDLKRHYNRTSEEITARQQKQRETRWYRVIPAPLLKVCVFVYEHSGPLCRIYFAD